MQEQEREEEYTIPELVDSVRAGNMDRRKLIKTLMFMGLSAAGAGTIAAVAARQITSSPAPHVNGDNNAQQHMQQHDQHLSNQATGNVQQLQDDYHEDAIVEDSMHARPFVGRTAIM